MDTDAPATKSINDDLASARTLIKADRALLEAALSGLEADGKPVEPTVAAAVQSLQVQQWVYLQHTKSFAVFLDEKIENAYAVRALTTPLDELSGEPPFLFEASLLAFEGLFVCDGLVLGPVALGAGYRKELKASYVRLRKDGKFHAHATAIPSK